MASTTGGTLRSTSHASPNQPRSHTHAPAPGAPGQTKSHLSCLSFYRQEHAHLKCLFVKIQAAPVFCLSSAPKCRISAFTVSAGAMAVAVGGRFARQVDVTVSLSEQSLVQHHLSAAVRQDHQNRHVDHPFFIVQCLRKRDPYHSASDLSHHSVFKAKMSHVSFSFHVFRSRQDTYHRVVGTVVHQVIYEVSELQLDAGAARPNRRRRVHRLPTPAPRPRQLTPTRLLPTKSQLSRTFTSVSEQKPQFLRMCLFVDVPVDL